MDAAASLNQYGDKLHSSCILYVSHEACISSCCRRRVAQNSLRQAVSCELSVTSGYAVQHRVTLVTFVSLLSGGRWLTGLRVSRLQGVCCWEASKQVPYHTWSCAQSAFFSGRQHSFLGVCRKSNSTVECTQNEVEKPMGTSRKSF